jgi:hypothetical protein
VDEEGSVPFLTSVYEMHGAFVHCELSRLVSQQGRFVKELSIVKKKPVTDHAVQYPEWHVLPALNQREAQSREQRQKNEKGDELRFSDALSSRVHGWFFSLKDCLYDLWQRSENVSRLPLSCEALPLQASSLWKERGEGRGGGTYIQLSISEEQWGGVGSLSLGGCLSFSENAVFRDRVIPTLLLLCCCIDPQGHHT